MTVTSTYSPIQYTGNGVTTAFSFPYLFYANSEIVPSIYDSSTGLTTTPSVTITGAGNPSGGTVTCAVAPTSTQILTLQRIAPFTQPTEYEAYSPLPPASIERNLDELTFQTQQLDVSVGNSIRAPTTDTNPSMMLPAAAVRANQTLIFDSNGNVTVGSTATGAIVSAAMLPVVEASTLAIGRTAFGLGSAAVLPSTAFLNVSLNLSDVSTPSTARVNLGLGTVATINTDGNTAHFLRGDGTFVTPSVTGKLIQTVYNAYTTYTSGTATIAFNNTLPTTSSGTATASVSITPTSSSNYLEIIATGNCSGGGTRICGFIAQSGSSNALIANGTAGNSSQCNEVTIVYRMLAGTTSATTFTLYMGDSAATYYINGNSGGQIYGGGQACTILIREVSP